MNLQNIISAGRMMAIVVALLGAFHCGATFALKHEGMASGIASGVTVIVCGLVLAVMFGRVARKTASAEAPPASLGTAILAVGSLVALAGAADVALAWHDPFSWMTAIVAIAIFIDALCLKIELKIEGEK